MNQQYYAGTGRRKSAVARVRLTPGTGAIVINGKPLEEVFNRPSHQTLILKPFRVTENQDKFNAQVKVAGGGISGWAGAIAHGIARAMLKVDENLRKPLRQNGLLTRDPRVKERKKYGLKRARKAPQYTKR
ncbi:MAG: 30S ribosomal protein S9 [Dehalococcoidia bacterium]|nr:30S ribosomal protein S9 [Dehalococcoidia bacterium]